MHCPLTTPGSRFMTPYGGGLRGPGCAGGRRQAALIPRRHARTHAPMRAPRPAAVPAQCSALPSLACFLAERGRWSCGLVHCMPPPSFCFAPVVLLLHALAYRSQRRRHGMCGCAWPGSTLYFDGDEWPRCMHQLRVNVRWASMHPWRNG
jgi:hypothetical protein